MTVIGKATQEYYECRGDMRRCTVGEDGICEDCQPITSERAMVLVIREYFRDVEAAHSKLMYDLRGLV